MVYVLGAGEQNVAHDFATGLIDNHHVRAARDVNPLRVGINRQTVPCSVTPNRYSSGYLVARSEDSTANKKGTAARRSSHEKKSCEKLPRHWNTSLIELYERAAPRLSLHLRHRAF